VLTSPIHQKELYYISIAHNKSKHITEFTIAPHKAAAVILQLLWSHLDCCVLWCQESCWM